MLKEKDLIVLVSSTTTVFRREDCTRRQNFAIRYLPDCTVNIDGILESETRLCGATISL